MTASTDTDPAVKERGPGARPGRRAHSRTPWGGGSRNGAGHLVGGRPAPIQLVAGRPRRESSLARGVIGADRGR
jgi:hypothetical protein